MIINGEAANRPDNKQLFENLRRHLAKKVAQMQVKPGQVLNRYITGSIYIMSGSASLYQIHDERRVFLERLCEGRIYTDPLIEPLSNRKLQLITEEPGEIAVFQREDTDRLSVSLKLELHEAIIRELYFSCVSTRNHLFDLRNLSAPTRLRAAILSAAEPGAAKKVQPGWRPISIQRDTLLDMCHVSYRQFKRLLPELCSDGVIRISDSGDIEVNIQP